MRRRLWSWFWLPLSLLTCCVSLSKVNVSEPAEPTVAFPTTWSEVVAGDAFKVRPKVRGTPQTDASALIVSIARYRDGTEALGAHHDAERFRTICSYTLGIPRERITWLRDEHAMAADINQAVRALPKSQRIYVYFAGIGARSEASSALLLLPYDAQKHDLAQTSLKLIDLQRGLPRTADSIVFLDAGFAPGQTRALSSGTRPLERVEVHAGPASAIVLSARASGPLVANEEGSAFSLALERALLRGDADGDRNGTVTLNEFVTYENDELRRSNAAGERPQQTELVLSGDPSRLELVWGLHD